MPKKYWLALAVSLLGVGLYAANGLRRGYNAAHPWREHVTEKDRATLKRTFPNLREISFQTADGLTLRGAFIPPENGVVIVYVHGLWGNRMAFLPEAQLFAKRGYGALLFDSRAHGESDGSVATWGAKEQYDVQRAIDFALQQPGVQRAAVLGFSVGSSSVALATAHGTKASAVILYAIWTTLEEEIADKMRERGPLAVPLYRLAFEASGADVDAVRPLDIMSTLAPGVPLLIMAGDGDEDTPPPITERMFAAARQPKQLWMPKGLGHGFHVDCAEPGEYEAHVGGFLKSVFGY